MSFIPVLRMLAATPEHLEQRAVAIAAAATSSVIDAIAVSDTGRCGGAALPDTFLPTWAVRVTSPTGSTDAVYQWFLQHYVVGRRARDTVLLDLRSVCPEDDPEVVAALGSFAGRVRPRGATTAVPSQVPARGSVHPASHCP